MNGSRVRGGEGRFITFVFFFIDKKGDSIENNKIKGYKSTLTTPHLWPIFYNKKITGNLKNSIIFFRFTTTFPEYSIILFKTVRKWMKPCFLTADYSLFLYPYVYCLGSVTEKYGLGVCCSKMIAFIFSTTSRCWSAISVSSWMSVFKL